jgi:hypothetical protein
MWLDTGAEFVNGSSAMRGTCVGEAEDPRRCADGGVSGPQCVRYGTALLYSYSLQGLTHEVGGLLDRQGHRRHARTGRSSDPVPLVESTKFGTPGTSAVLTVQRPIGEAEQG